MKILLRIPLLLLFFANASAQNLVPNFSFEDTASCPTGPNQLFRATGWSTYGLSPDYFNRCAPPSNSASVPANAFGWQQPFDGDAYIDIALWENIGWREFVGTQLFQPLTPGSKYYVSAWISRAYGPSQNATGACNNFCFRFSTVPYSGTHPAPVDNFAHYRSTAMVTDTSGWTHIFGSFIADSAYQYLILGNFFDNSNTDTASIGGASYASYFVDYVCVTTDSATCSVSAGIEDHAAKNSAVIFPNPSSDGHFYLEKNEFISAQSIRVVDVLGQEIPVTILESAGNTEIILPFRGVFFVELKTSSGIVVRKIMW